MAHDGVDILLSTYNGVAYLDEQIKSIVGQSYQDWRLIIRDDGSNDQTRELLAQFAKSDSRIKVLAFDGLNLGPALSFLTLMKHVEGRYFMFCDQDDFWLPHKVEVTVNALRERDHEPHLVHTDLKVVDEKLKLISASFMKHQRFSIRGARSLKRMLMQNIIVGCTVGGNRKLLEASRVDSLDFPGSVVMHDWWLGLVAKVFGHVTFIDEQTILYRQHSKNALGAQGSSFKRYIWLLKNAQPWVKAKNYLKLVASQSRSFVLFYGKSMSTDNKKIFNSVAALGHGFAAAKLLVCFAKGISMHALDRNIALVLSVLVPSTTNRS